MYKIIAAIIPILMISGAHGQKNRNISANIDFHINSTLYDRTRSNNGVGFGLALQTLINTGTRFSPALEIAADGYGGTEELHMTPLGEPVYGKSSVSTVLAGSLFNVSSKFDIGGMLGAGFFNSEVHFAIKPFMGYRLFNDRVIAKIAWANIFQRDKISNQSFGYLSFGAGVKLF